MMKKVIQNLQRRRAERDIKRREREKRRRLSQELE
jgi:hypothetical protein